MNPLNFIQHLLTLRAIKRELADEKTASKALKAETFISLYNAERATTYLAQPSEAPDFHCVDQIQERDILLFSAASWSDEDDDYLITSVDSIDHSFQVRFSYMSGTSSFFENRFDVQP